MAKNNSELKSIQKKLMAAIAMVLVASVMVVSSSYAWFTLSTAPEVTGIQTSVGSNGNLEMALREVADLTSIQSMSSGGGSFPAANPYWGNLVDLGYSKYGLGEISLAPARLNVSTSAGTPTTKTVTITNTEATYTATEYNGYEISDIETSGPVDGNYTHTITYKIPNNVYTVGAQTSYLWYPTYGADGRISTMERNMDIGIYNETTKTFGIGTVGTDYGVKAIGTVSGLSDAELALRNAKNAVYSTIVEVGGDVETSLAQNATDLANILITYYLDTNAKFSNDDWDKVNEMVLTLESMAGSLKSALDQAVIAVGVYQNQTITAVEWDGSAIVTTGGTIDWNAEELVDPYASLKDAYADLKVLTEDIGAAKTNMPAKTEAGGYTYDQFSNTFNKLMTTANLRLYVEGGKAEGYSVSEFKTAALENVSAIVSSGVTINITGGVYAQIAEFVGNRTAGATISVDGSAVGDTFAGQTLSVRASMTTAAAAPAKGFHLVYANTWLPLLTVSGEGASASSLTDLYAYLIDFAFRTNATGSSLMLQTSAIDRINNTNTSSQTQGGGSYMEFELGTGTGYTVQQMMEVMKAVRIVFIDKDNKVVAVGALEVPETVEEGTTKVNAPIYLHSYSFDENGVCTLGAKIEANSDGATALMDLVQNEPTAVSTLVYLDGDQVDNGDVAINGTSLTGTMNLQFSSSADLVPMEYTFTDSEGDDEETTLATPSNFSWSGTTLSWDVVDGATGYAVVIGDDTEHPVTTATNSVDLATALTGVSEATTITVVASDGTNTSSAGTTTYNPAP